MAVIFDSHKVSQIQQATDIVELISEHLSLKKKGKEMVGVCPFHEDHRPSLYVNGHKQIFKCFACGAGGDVFKFVQMRENLTFPQAVERLANRAGIELTVGKSSKRPSGPSQIDPNELAKVNAWAADHFQQNLYNEQRGEYARKYIAERQITAETAKKWMLGLAVDSQNDLIKAAKQRAISLDHLSQVGLLVNRGAGEFRDKFVNRLIFPITDVTARVIGFGGRALGENTAKYINSPTTELFDKSNSLYGLQQARDSIVSTGLAAVVEGYTDCIMAHQFGYKNVVATLGTSFTAGHARILRRYAKKVVLIFDSDAAGIEAANRALEICLSQAIDIELVSIEGHNDPCDFLLAEGKTAFERLVNNATDVFTFKWNRLLQRFAVNGTLVDNKAAIEEFLQTIAIGLWAGNLSVIDRGLIVNRLSRIIGLDAGQINAELRKRVTNAARTAKYSTGVGAENQQAPLLDFGQSLSASAQRELLEVLVNEPKLFSFVKHKIAVTDFDVPILRQIAAVLFEMLDSEPVPSLAGILSRMEPVEAGAAVVKLAQAGEEKGNFQARISGALDVMLRMKGRSRLVKPVEDPQQFLKHLYESTGKQNPHNVGMT